MMNKPMHNIPAVPPPFKQRLQKVSSEIARRATTQPTQQRNAAKARLWIRWISKNVLEVQA